MSAKNSTKYNGSNNGILLVMAITLNVVWCTSLMIVK